MRYLAWFVLGFLALVLSGGLAYADDDALPLDGKTIPPAGKKTDARPSSTDDEPLPLDGKKLPDEPSDEDKEPLPSTPQELVESVSRGADLLYVEIRSLRGFLKRSGLRIDPSLIERLREKSGWESEYVGRVGSGCNSLEICLEGEVNYYRDETLRLGDVFSASAPWLDGEWVTALTQQFRQASVAHFNAMAASLFYVVTLQRGYRADWATSDEATRLPETMLAELVRRLKAVTRLTARSYRLMDKLYLALHLRPMEPWTRVELPATLSLELDRDGTAQYVALPYVYRNRWQLRWLSPKAKPGQKKVAKK